MRPRTFILSLLTMVLLLAAAVPAQARCHCRRTHRTAYRRVTYSYEPVTTRVVTYRTHYRPLRLYYPTVHFTSVPVAYRTGRSGGAFVKTDVEPDESSVYVDGRYVGIAERYDGYPQYLRVSPGRHRVTFAARGYAPYSVVVNASRGRVVGIDHSLSARF